MNKIWQFIHDGQLIRRFIIIWALVMTTFLAIEMLDYITIFSEKGKDWLVGISAVVAAVTTPFIGLTGFLLKHYAQHPYADGKDSKDKKDGA